MKIIDGKALADKMRSELRIKAENFETKHGRKIGVAFVVVGDNPASEVYIRNKVRACAQTNVRSVVHRMSADTTEAQLVAKIRKLNTNSRVDGFLVQLPLPPHLDERKILSLIKPSKDIDGFHVANAGALMLGQSCLPACTPAACIELLKSTGVPLTGKHAVVVGRSNIVGKPVALMLLQENCTVTVCHSKTANLVEITRGADILVAAIGRREFITGDMIKPGAIVIDVGINRHEDKLYGDVHFESVSRVASHITPVPGGVGPMTVTMVIANAVRNTSEASIANALKTVLN